MNKYMDKISDRMEKRCKNQFSGVCLCSLLHFALYNNNNNNNPKISSKQ